MVLLNLNILVLKFVELASQVLDQRFVISEVVKSFSTKISIKIMQLTNPTLQYTI